MGSDHPTATKEGRVGLHQKNEFFQCSQKAACQSRLAMWPARKA